jgi:hypothetical protein
MKWFFLIFFLHFTIFVGAQDDVLQVVERKRPFATFSVPFTIIDKNYGSPLFWGGGAALSFVNNPFKFKPLYVGGELTYQYLSGDRINYDSGNYLRTSVSFFGLNTIVQFRPMRLFAYGLYPEVTVGGTFPVLSSSYVYWDEDLDEETSRLEKLNVKSALNAGVGVGIRFFDNIEIKVRYLFSGNVAHFHPSTVTDTNGEIVYLYVRKPLNRVEISAGITFN